ncbi:MAG: restriction modification system DNA specificity subunit [Rhodospirillaceae bacterium]|nr:MAG: restriction modification system DNA specificity subunit [Rhodospirillaceae bacterium]
MISAAWKQRPIGELFDIGAGKTMSSAAREGAQKTPFLRTSNVLWDEIDISTVDEMAIPPHELAGKLVELGDLLVCEGGEIGRAAIWNGEIDPMSFQNHLHRLRPLADDVEPRFYVYFLYSAFTQMGIFEGVGNKTTIPNLSRNRLAALEIPHPDLDEQRDITRALSHVRDAIKLHDRSTETAHSLKRAAMRTLFTRGLKGEAQKDTEIGLVPESWEVSTLGGVSNIERGRFLHRPRNEPRFYGGDTPFVQTGDVVRSGGRIREFTQSLNADGVAISRVFPDGTILITIAANIGYTGILQFDSACPDSLVAITPNEKVTAEFLEYWLQTQQPDMDRFASNGTQKNINIQFLLPWPVVVPSLDEQQEIVAILDAIDRKIDLHSKKRAVLDELFKALLHKLMTGEIRISDLDLSALAPARSAEAVA